MKKQYLIVIGLMLLMAAMAVVSCEKPQHAPGAPEVESDSLVVTGSSVICYGNVLSDGGDSIRERGICWYSEHYPTWIADHTPPVISDHRMVAGGDLGNFSRTLNHYGSDSIYYFRAYARNDVGVSYGSEMGLVCIFDPNLHDDDNDSPVPVLMEALPTVTIASATAISENQALCCGAVTNDGGSPIIEKGFCWRTNGNPYSYVYVSVPGSDEFQGNLVNLTPHTTYYVRAYAVNAKGTGYSREIMFTTLTSDPSEPPVAVPPTIALITGGGYSENGTVMEEYVEYCFGFEMSSPVGLSKLTVYDHDEWGDNQSTQTFFMDSIDLSGRTTYVYTNWISWHWGQKKNTSWIITGKVTDINGLSSSVSIRFEIADDL